MKSTMWLILFCLFTQIAFSQQKAGGSSPAIDLSEKQGFISAEIKSTKTSSETYALELFPGQKFNGWWYSWSNGGTVSGVHKEIPEVTWLSITPKNVTSTGCTDIIPVKYSFVAPATEGLYVTTIIDSLGHWDSVRVELTVTKSPAYYTTRAFGVNMESLTFKSYLRYTPFNFEGNTCVKDYFATDTLHFNFHINSGIDWLTISPSSGKIFMNGKMDYQTTIKKRPFDSTWVILENGYYSYPIIYHYYVAETEPKDYLLEFNGDNVISTGYYPHSSTRTLMYWVRFDTISIQGIGTHDMKNHRFYLGINNNNTLYAGLGDNYTPLTSLNLIPGKWYHLALTTTQDADSALVYLNATEVSRWAYTFSGESEARLYIGGRNDLTSWGAGIIGLIDEVQVWEKPLNRNEIIQYMFTPPVGNESGLVLYYPFNEGWGNFTKNSVENYYNGILYSNPIWIDSIKRPDDPSIITSLEENVPDEVKGLNLNCRPNPFSKNAEITYNLPDNGNVTLQLFDMRGTLVKTLINIPQLFGLQTCLVNDQNLPPGIYFVRLTYTSSKGRIIQSIRIIRTDLN